MAAGAALAGCLAAFALIVGAGESTTAREQSQAAGTAAAPTPSYSIVGIRYATLKGFPLNALVMGAPEGHTIDISMSVWLICGGGHVVLFDSGFYRRKWLEQFKFDEYMSPDAAVQLAAVEPGDVTDVIISHAHWDHMGGIDLFPKATIWIQKGEFEYYSSEAWQPGGKHGGIDPDDILELVTRNTRGMVRLIDGDDEEILPGIRVFTGARHTFASQYIRAAGEPVYVLASDNCYTYQNLREHKPGATFSPSDAGGNVAAQWRMIELAGDADRVVPGHDPAVYERFPTKGRVAKIR